MCFIGFMFFYSLNFAFAALHFYLLPLRFYLLHFALSSVICTLPCLSVFVKLCLPRLGQTTELCILSRNFGEGNGDSKTIEGQKVPYPFCILSGRYVVGTAAASAFEARMKHGFLCECAELAPLAVRPDWFSEFGQR